MKSRKFKIRIKGTDKPIASGITRTLKRAAQGKLQDSEYDLVITFPDLSWLSKVFSPERIRLIQTVRKEHPESIYQLAKILGRHLANVQRDVNELANIGILELKKTKKKGSKRETVQPSFDWEGFDIAV